MVFKLIYKFINKMFNKMFNIIAHIINNVLVNCFSSYYYEVVVIKRINSSGSFIEYETDEE